MRVVIGEDLFLLREGLVKLLSAHGFDIVAAVGTAPDLLAALVGERPDVGIVDVRLPPTHTDDGLRMQRARQTRPASTQPMVVPPSKPFGMAESFFSALNSSVALFLFLSLIHI